MAIYTGLRRGELFKLEWRDIAFDKGEKGLITVRDTKNHETRYVPMSNTVRQALLKHPRRMVPADGNSKARVSPLVFSSDSGNAITDVKKGFAGALRRAGIQRHVRFHDLRHTFASHLVMRGVDIRTVARLLGHKDIKVTMRYAHLGPDHLQSAVDALEGELEPQEKSQTMTG